MKLPLKLNPDYAVPLMRTGFDYWVIEDEERETVAQVPFADFKGHGDQPYYQARKDAAKLEALLLVDAVNKDHSPLHFNAIAELQKA